MKRIGDGQRRVRHAPVDVPRQLRLRATRKSPPESTGLNLKEKIALIGSAIAIVISVFGFFRDNLLGQRVLRVAVFNLEPSHVTKIKADILIVNAGKHAEVLYSAGFVFRKEIGASEAIAANDAVGPFVLEPGKALVHHIETERPTPQAMQKLAMLRDGRGSFEVSIAFVAITPGGTRASRPFEYKVGRMETFGGPDSKDFEMTHGPRDSSGLVDVF